MHKNYLSPAPPVPVLIQTAWMGDAVISLAAVRLAARRAGRGVILVTRPPLASLFEGDPAVSHLLTYDKRGADAGLPGLLRAAARVRDALGDAPGVALLLQSSPRSRLLARAANLRDTFAPPPFTPPSHRLPLRPHDELALVDRALPGLAPSLPDDGLLRLRPDERADAATRLGASPTPRIALILGAAQPTKRPPLPLLLALLPHLTARASLVLCGGPEDRPRAAQLLPHAPHALDTTGEPLRHAAATLAACQLAVAGDTGLAHLAQAVGTPVLTLYGPTPHDPFRATLSPALGPRTPLLRGLPCQPCSASGGPACPLGHPACLALAPDLAFLQAIRDALDRQKF